MNLLLRAITPSSSDCFIEMLMSVNGPGLPGDHGRLTPAPRHYALELRLLHGDVDVCLCLWYRHPHPHSTKLKRLTIYSGRRFFSS
ncbi:hypothetical protein CEXT_50991 [Caerostris extrusa]|uniref:Uncharacterized protein n=1 Tax=Caerostris extrusa TaxID=172846 RepID=A0AAV4RPR0_CAEEX|nr:hypothetical protein CEXT_50991 [Caerostris extrusa]